MVLVLTALPHKCQTPYVKIIDLNLGTNLIRRAGRDQHILLGMTNYHLGKGR